MVILVFAISSAIGFAVELTNSVSIDIPENVEINRAATVTISISPEPYLTYSGAIIQLILPESVEVFNVQGAKMTTPAEYLDGRTWSFITNPEQESFTFDIIAVEKGEFMVKGGMLNSINFLEGTVIPDIPATTFEVVSNHISGDADNDGDIDIDDIQLVIDGYDGEIPTEIVLQVLDKWDTDLD